MTMTPQEQEAKKAMFLKKDMDDIGRRLEAHGDVIGEMLDHVPEVEVEGIAIVKPSPKSTYEGTPHLLSEMPEEEQRRVILWVLCRTQTAPTIGQFNSYGMKHMCESELRRAYGTPNYVSNCALKAALAVCGRKRGRAYGSPYVQNPCYRLQMRQRPLRVDAGTVTMARCGRNSGWTLDEGPWTTYDEMLRETIGG